jgi:hypothetical protein
MGDKGEKYPNWSVGAMLEWTRWRRVFSLKNLRGTELSDKRIDLHPMRLTLDPLGAGML